MNPFCVVLSEGWWAITYRAHHCLAVLALPALDFIVWISSIDYAKRILHSAFEKIDREGGSQVPLGYASRRWQTSRFNTFSSSIWWTQQNNNSPDPHEKGWKHVTIWRTDALAAEKEKKRKEKERLPWMNEWGKVMCDQGRRNGEKWSEEMNLSAWILILSVYEIFFSEEFFFSTTKFAFGFSSALKSERWSPSRGLRAPIFINGLFWKKKQNKKTWVWIGQLRKENIIRFVFDSIWSNSVFHKPSVNRRLMPASCIIDFERKRKKKMNFSTSFLQRSCVAICKSS